MRTFFCASVRLVSFAAADGERVDAGKIAAAGQRLEAEGADFIDLDPGLVYPSVGRPRPDDELPLLVPVLRKARQRLRAPLIVTTPNAETARRAIDLGADAVYDAGGLTFDPQLARTVNDSDAALILGCAGILGRAGGDAEERREQAAPANLVETAGKALQASLLRACRAGIDRRRVVLDPGLGQGRTADENFDLLKGLRRLAAVGQGIQASLTDIRFLLGSMRAGEAERQAGMAAAAALAAAEGAHILRVAEPRSVKFAAAAVDRIYRAGDQRGRAD